MVGDLPESRGRGGGGKEGENGGLWERERLITVLKLKTWWWGEGLPRVEGCSMGALSNLHFFCVGWSASSWWSYPCCKWNQSRWSRLSKVGGLDLSVPWVILLNLLPWYMKILRVLKIVTLVSKWKFVSFSVPCSKSVKQGSSYLS